MNEEQYISERVDKQIVWYGQKSQNAQKCFKALRGFEIIAAALIPIIAGFGGEDLPITFILGSLGALIAVASAFISLNQYQENWIEYRTTCESLKHEKFLFLTRAAPYHDEKPLIIFVQRIESLISKENNTWSQYAQSNVEKTGAINDHLHGRQQF